MGGGLGVRTSGSDAEVLPEDTPISVLHLVEFLIRPMSLVDTILSGPSSLHWICVLRFNSRPPYGVIVVHPSYVPATEHDLSHALALNHWWRWHVCSSIVLCIPIKDKLPVVHLANLPLLLVHSKVTRPNCTEIRIGHGWDISRGVGDDVSIRWRGRGRHCIGCGRL